MLISNSVIHLVPLLAVTKLWNFSQLHGFWSINLKSYAEFAIFDFTRDFHVKRVVFTNLIDLIKLWVSFCNRVNFVELVLHLLTGSNPLLFKLITLEKLNDLLSIAIQIFPQEANILYTSLLPSFLAMEKSIDFVRQNSEYCWLM